jgi:hypothetical protein
MDAGGDDGPLLDEQAASSGSTSATFSPRSTTGSSIGKMT